MTTNPTREGKAGYGYNAATDCYEDLIAAGVIDPTRVVRVALQSAASRCRAPRRSPR
jgi:chaperonin GroEL